MPGAWMVRAGRNGFLFDRFKEMSLVALGWSCVGSPSDLADKQGLCVKLREIEPAATDQSLMVAAGQLIRFSNEIKIGDRVVTYDPRSRTYLCGIIKGECEYVPNPNEPGELTNRRMVAWQKEKPRDDLSISARNTLGSTLTLFWIPSTIADEIWSDKPVLEAEDLSGAKESVGFLDATAQEIGELADEKIKDRIARLDEYQMQDLVAGILRAMGYKTTVSKPGSDLSKDIVASPDGFGFQTPRIVVEVKHRPKERIGAPMIRTFLGARKAHESGLFVSTGGFTKEAYYEADRASIPLTLLDFEKLIDAVLVNYPRFDEKTRQLVPLTPIYWPL
jgi:restriction system protein